MAKRHLEQKQVSWICVLVCNTSVRRPVDAPLPGSSFPPDWRHRDDSCEGSQGNALPHVRPAFCDHHCKFQKSFPQINRSALRQCHHRMIVMRLSLPLAGSCSDPGPRAVQDVLPLLGGRGRCGAHATGTFLQGARQPHHQAVAWNARKQVGPADRCSFLSNAVEMTSVTSNFDDHGFFTITVKGHQKFFWLFLTTRQELLTSRGQQFSKSYFRFHICRGVKQLGFILQNEYNLVTPSPPPPENEISKVASLGWQTNRGKKWSFVSQNLMIIVGRRFRWHAADFRLFFSCSPLVVKS